MSVVRFAFDITQPVNMDVYLLSFRRYTIGEEGEESKSEIWTTEGWHEYRNWDELPVHALPAISGTDMFNYQGVKAMLENFEREIKAFILASHDLIDRIDETETTDD